MHQIKTITIARALIPQIKTITRARAPKPASITQLFDESLEMYQQNRQLATVTSSINRLQP